jgi:hypothetical protein
MIPSGARASLDLPGGGSVAGYAPPGRARGIDALHNEPAAQGCDVEEGDNYQGEDRDLVESVGEPGLSDPGPALRAINRREPFAIGRRKHRRSSSFIRTN